MFSVFRQIDISPVLCFRCFLSLDHPVGFTEMVLKIIHMKKVAIIGNPDFFGTSLLTHTTDNSTSGEVIINENTTVVYEIKNYKVDPLFVPNNKIRSKYKRNLKYRQ